MNFATVDLNLLRVFDVLMREGNVTLTAERLGRTQSAVSHSLGKLRALFEDRLFVREGSGMRPTPRAIELSARISDALASIKATIDRYQRFDPKHTTRIFRVGLNDYHGAMVIPELIKRFRAEAPCATLNVVPTSKDEAVRLVLARKLDCAVVPDFDWYSHDLLSSEVDHEALICAIWSGSELRKGPLSLERYLKAIHIQISGDGSSEGLADKALREIGLKRQVAATIPNYMLIPWVLRGTNFVALCSDSMPLLLDQSSDVRFLKAPLALAPMPILLITHNQATGDPATIWLKRLVEEIYSDRRARKNVARRGSRRWRSF